MPAKAKGRFIDPMLLLRTDSLPNDGDRWEYQLKFDGYRAIAFKTRGKLHLRSRNDNDFSLRYANVVKGLAKLPDETKGVRPVGTGPAGKNRDGGDGYAA